MRWSPLKITRVRSTGGGNGVAMAHRVETSFVLEKRVADWKARVLSEIREETRCVLDQLLQRGSAKRQICQRRQLHTVVMELVFHPCVASAVRAPHQEIPTSATRIQLSRVHCRASDWRRPAGVFPPPASRTRWMVGRK